MAPAMELADLADHDDRIIDMAHDALGNQLASAHESNCLKLWKRGPKGSWKFALALESGHESESIAAVRWAPPALSPAMLASVAADGVLAIYEVPVLSGVVGTAPMAARVLKIQDAEAQLTDVAFADDGILATFGVEQVVRIYWTYDGGKRWGLQTSLDLLGDAGSGLTFMPGTSRVLCAGRIIVSCGKQRWNYEPQLELNVANEVQAVAWGRSGYIGVGRRDGGVEIWKPAPDGFFKEAVLEDAIEHTDARERAMRVERIAWDVHGEVISSSHSDGSVRVWARCAQRSQNGGGSWPWSLRDVLPAINEEL
jgi:WD40 repeat protein